MNYHGNNKDGQGSKNHSALKHILHMALCCGLPIVILASLPRITRFSPATGGILGKIAPFLCPIMMLSVLPMMFGGNKKGSCCNDKKEDNDNSKPIELNKPEE